MIHVFYFQLYGYNAHLFTNLSEAVLHPHGAVGVAIMVQESERSSNKALRHITSQLNKVNICLINLREVKAAVLSIQVALAHGMFSSMFLVIDQSGLQSSPWTPNGE